MQKLDRKFYCRDAVTLAEALLGKVLVHKINGQRLSARIVETEAYMGVTDKAAHSYGGRRTPRVEVMYGEAGYAYVFMIYGMYNCFNIVCMEKDIPQAVLIRTCEPLEGLDQMTQNRYKKRYNELTKYQRKNLTNGPGKLCAALSLDRTHNGIDLCKNVLYLEDSEFPAFSMTKTTRVGIDYAEEARDFLWRFYITGNEYVSVK
ncbi:putative 3-methyladenine DNA glycosylase [bioreactor metagenome]|uniref:Putative 3-methyladenine DNA glycosylase n=1 Tax=bioreactor metagenome TaxID=1076179 RepID=A0A645ESA3_9ZZZZ